jgi:hypothetical protein
MAAVIKTVDSPGAEALLFFLLRKASSFTHPTASLTPLAFVPSHSFYILN